MKTTLIFSILMVLCSCGNETELTHPFTIKGLRLGMNYEDQKLIAESNGICVNDLPNSSICQYKVFEDVYARPRLLFSYYNGEKVLGEVELTFNSPTSFVSLTDLNGNSVLDYPSLQKWQIIKLKAKYNEKYGPIIEEKEVDYGGYAIWKEDDMIIRMDYQKSLLVYSIDYRVRFSYEDDSYCTIIKYHFDENKRKLLEDGNPSGILGADENI